MRYIFLSFMMLVLQASTANAEVKDIAICGEVEGHAYYHNSNIVQRSHAGWVKDKISNGKTVLKQLGPKDFDILVFDASGTIWSATQDGGLIQVMRKSSSEITVLHISKISVIEVYNFYKERDGSLKFDLVQSKGGTLRIHKSSVMTGKCKFINFQE